MKLRIKAAVHELSCWECRVTWLSWFQRLAGSTSGYSPKLSPRLERLRDVSYRRGWEDAMTQEHPPMRGSQS